MNRRLKLVSALVICAAFGATPLVPALAKDQGQPAGQRQAQQQPPKTKTPKTNRGANDCSKITDSGKRDECVQAQHQKVPANKSSTTPATPAVPATPGKGDVQTTTPATPATPATPGGGRGQGK